jgi:hypothetical protein
VDTKGRLDFGQSRKILARLCLLKRSVDIKGRLKGRLGILAKGDRGHEREIDNFSVR